MQKTAQHFKVCVVKKTLKDFNRVQSREEGDSRRSRMQALMDQIKTGSKSEDDFAQLIIETLFGFILRKESLT